MIVINNVIKKEINYAGCNFSGIAFISGFSGTDLSNSNMTGAEFEESVMDFVNFTNCNFDQVQFTQPVGSFLEANFTGVKNMPEAYNTKAKFIAAVGAENVNAKTIWIDGTSILD